MLPVGYHEVDAIIAQDIGNLVGIGNDTDGALLHCHPSKLGRHHHTALNVNMGVDEAGQEIGRTLRNIALGRDALDDAVGYGYLSVVDAA